MLEHKTHKLRLSEMGFSNVEMSRLRGLDSFLQLCKEWQWRELRQTLFGGTQSKDKIQQPIGRVGPELLQSFSLMVP